MPKSNDKLPYMQFYPRDFLSDINVQSMSLEQLGAYIKLMSICWIQDFIPNDNEELSDILGIDKNHFEKNIEKKIRKVFEVDTNDIRKLFNPRIKKDKKEAKRKYTKRSEVNKANIQKRWQQKKSDTNRIPIVNESNTKVIRNDTIPDTDTDTDTDTDINNKKNTQKKEPNKNQIVEKNEMVETESKIPSDSKKDKLNANFEYVWKKYSEACKKQNRRPGNKSKSSKLFDYAIKNKWASEVVESILFYAEDCILRNCYLKNLESFLSKSENYIEEWKNGSENHQLLLGLKKNAHNSYKNVRGFETRQERIERDVQQNREQITRILNEPEEDMDLPWVTKQKTNLRLIE